MSPLDIGKTAPIHPARLAAGDRPASPETPPAPARSAAAGGGGVRVELASAAMDHSVPVDHDRVAQIRDALRDGTYPIVPAKIADALIAARLTLGGQA